VSPGVTGVGGSPLPEPTGAKVDIMFVIIFSMLSMPDCMLVIVVSIVDILIWMVYLVLPVRLEALEALSVSIVTVWVRGFLDGGAVSSCRVRRVPPPPIVEIESSSVRSFYKVKTSQRLGTSVAALSLAFILSKSAILGSASKTMLSSSS
jgi:hypothetical protein